VTPQQNGLSQQASAPLLLEDLRNPQECAAGVTRGNAASDQRLLGPVFMMVYVGLK